MIIFFEFFSFTLPLFQQTDFSFTSKNTAQEKYSTRTLFLVLPTKRADIFSLSPKRSPTHMNFLSERKILFKVSRIQEMLNTT